MAPTRSQLRTRLAALSVRAAVLARTTDDPIRRGVLFDVVAALGAAGGQLDRAGLDDDALAAIDAVLTTQAARLDALASGRPRTESGA